MSGAIVRWYALDLRDGLARFRHAAGLDKPFCDCQFLAARGRFKLVDEGPDSVNATGNGRREFIVRVRRKALNEKWVFKIMRAPHDHRVCRSGDDYQGKARISWLGYLVDARENPAYFIGLDKRAAVHCFAAPDPGGS